MREALYTFAIILYGCFSLPIFLRKKWAGGRYALRIKELLGFGFPRVKKGAVWIHAVSVGEVKVATTLIPFLQKAHPEAQFLVTCATKTGVEKAEASFPEGAVCVLLPLDIPFLMRRLCQRVQPRLVLVSESDFWWGWLRAAKQSGATIALINGKLSERSYTRYARFRWFARDLFGQFDLLCVQNEEYAARFRILVPEQSIVITGNMKYDVSVPPPPSEQAFAVTFGSTHSEEEGRLRDLATSLVERHPDLTLYFVPRHPERFAPVADTLRERGISFSNYSDGGRQGLVVVDVMGQLVALYALSKVSVIAGSFAPPLQGHDIFEPILVGSVPIFGPCMDSQKEMVDLVHAHGAGKQVPLTHLEDEITRLLVNTEASASLTKAGQLLLRMLQGSAERTWEKISKVC